MSLLFTVLYVVLVAMALFVFATRRPTYERQLGQRMSGVGLLVLLIAVFVPFGLDNRALMFAIILSGFALIPMIGVVVRGLIDRSDTRQH